MTPGNGDIYLRDINGANYQNNYIIILSFTTLGLVPVCTIEFLSSTEKSQCHSYHDKSKGTTFKI